MVTALVQAEEERDTLFSTEILALAVLLMLAGNKTTPQLMRNADLLLLDHPDELAKIRSDRSLVPALIEEDPRSDSPVRAIQEEALDGGKIPAGQNGFLLLGAANRDECRFPEAGPLRQRPQSARSRRLWLWPPLLPWMRRGLGWKAGMPESRCCSSVCLFCAIGASG